MLKINGILIWMVLFVVEARASETDLDLIIENINKMTLQQKVSETNLVTEFINISQKGLLGSADDVKLFLDVNVPDSEIEELVSKQKTDGSWPDINYSDKSRSNWNPKMHAIRFQVLAKAYKTPGSTYFGVTKVSQSLHLAMNFWFKAKLKCPNWWYNEIGIPLWMGPGFLLIKDELSKEELDGAISVLSKRKLNATGQNKVWDAGNAIFLGLLTQNIDLVKSYRDSITSEIYQTTREGLQHDYSFHQHGPQMQFGNYGLAYINSMSYWARAMHGSKFAFSQEQLNYLSAYIKEGLQWTVWRGYMDFSACGRQVFKNALRSKSHNIAVSIINLSKAYDSAKIQLNRYVTENLNNTQLQNTFCGHKHFWRSDYTVHRTPGWYASVRMNSSRTVGVEMTNSENLQGFYAADGVMSLMIDGAEYNNIFPVWNWRRLPGLTVQDSVKATIASRPFGTHFVGGVTDGINGVSATTINHDGLMAYKAYFFVDNMIVCLGTGISSKKGFPVYTTLNQHWLNGNIKYSIKDGPLKNLADENEISASNIRAVYHHQTGYYIAGSKNVILSNKTQTGNWNRIAQFYKNETAAGKIFLLSLNHGNTRADSSYEYCIVPKVSETEFKKFINNPTYKTLIHTRNCMAITHKSNQIFSAAFFSKQSVNWGKIKVTSLTPGIVIIEKQASNTLKITVCDPKQELTEYVVAITGKYSGEGALYNPSLKQTIFTIPLPKSKGLIGSSVSAYYQF